MKASAGMPEVDRLGPGWKPVSGQLRGSSPTCLSAMIGPGEPGLFERVLGRENMLKALRAVETNRGAGGIDGMEVGQLRGCLKEHWAGIKERLLTGGCEPRPVRRVDIPKPGGGTRMLGIPTVLDRLIQQAIHPILSPIWEGEFSEHGYGFRPGRSAAHSLLPKTGSYLTDGEGPLAHSEALASVFMNRGIRTVRSVVWEHGGDENILASYPMLSAVSAASTGCRYREQCPTLSPLRILKRLDKIFKNRSHYCNTALDVLFFPCQGSPQKLRSRAAELVGSGARVGLGHRREWVGRWGAFCSRSHSAFGSNRFITRFGIVSGSLGRWRDSGQWVLRFPVLVEGCGHCRGHRWRSNPADAERSGGRVFDLVAAGSNLIPRGRPLD